MTSRRRPGPEQGEGRSESESAHVSFGFAGRGSTRRPGSSEQLSGEVAAARRCRAQGERSRQRVPGLSTSTSPARVGPRAPREEGPAARRALPLGAEASGGPARRAVASPAGPGARSAFAEAREGARGGSPSTRGSGTWPKRGPPMRLKEWLIAQVESGVYPGLRWEDREKREFRIPWKHAAKQHYRQQEDAALFKAWAIYKGKYHEGVDKADPSVWKTRLRCALNKSTDFREVPDRSHLDILEPYKVYQIVTEVSQEADKGKGKRPPKEPRQPPVSAQQESGVNRLPNQAGSPSDAGQGRREEPRAACLDSPGSPPAFQNSSLPDQLGYQVRGYFYGWSPAPFRCHASPRFVSPIIPGTDNETLNSDSWLHIRLYYCDVLVKEATTRTAEGCRITYRPVPAEDECLYGPSAMEQVQFPRPGTLAGDGPAAQVAGILEQLLPHLHRGILLWVAPEGVFMKRQCQGRVYWKGPLAPHEDRPNKLERERTYKLLDTQQFLRQLRGFLNHGKPPPQYQIHFCFGEEFPAAPNQKLHKFVTACVEPVFARDLCLHAQRLGPQSLRGPRPPGSAAPRNIVQTLKQLCSP